jgi:hypothetical protein
MAIMFCSSTARQQAENETLDVMGNLHDTLMNKSNITARSSEQLIPTKTLEADRVFFRLYQIRRLTP